MLPAIQNPPVIPVEVRCLEVRKNRSSGDVNGVVPKHLSSTGSWMSIGYIPILQYTIHEISMGSFD